MEIMAGNAGQLALVDVLGARRPINLGMLENPNLSPGDWVLIHMGFALELIDEAAAQEALSGLAMMGSPGDALFGPPAVFGQELPEDEELAGGVSR